MTEVPTFFKDQTSKELKQRKGLERTRMKQRRPGDADLMSLWSRRVLDRDRHVCRGCFQAANQAHHCVSRSLKEWRYHTDNGVAVCDACHVPKIEAYKCTFCPGVIEEQHCVSCGRRGFKVPVWQADEFMADGGQQVFESLFGSPLGWDVRDESEKQ